MGVKIYSEVYWKSMLRNRLYNFLLQVYLFNDYYFYRSGTAPTAGMETHRRIPYSRDDQPVT